MKKKNKIAPLNFLFLTISGIINAIGIVLFLTPVSLFDSGFSGTAMFLSSVTAIPLSVYLLILNLPFFAFGYKKQGIAFTVYSVYAVVIYSATAFVMQSVMSIDFSAGSPLAGNDLLLCAAFGGLISGIGSGLTIRFGGAIDGVEVMAVIFAKRLSITVGTFVMIYNVILYLVIGIVRHSWILPLYSIITYTVALKAVDFIVDGLDKAKSAMIITAAPEEICAELSENFGRGITIMRGEGYYSGEKKTIVYFVVNRFQIGKLKSIVQSVDPRAYVTLTEVSDIMRSSVKSTAASDEEKTVSYAISDINTIDRLKKYLEDECYRSDLFSYGDDHEQNGYLIKNQDGEYLLEYTNQKNERITEAFPSEKELVAAALNTAAADKWNKAHMIICTDAANELSETEKKLETLDIPFEKISTDGLYRLFVFGRDIKRWQAENAEKQQYAAASPDTSEKVKI